MTAVTKVYSADPVTMSEQCRHHAIRTAVQKLVDGEPTAAAEILRKSLTRCAHLDNRPLDPDRVAARYVDCWRSMSATNPVDSW